jgi:hypothetical protein
MKSAAAASFAALLLLACPHGITLPDAKTPILQNVNLHGTAACPTTTDGSCPLPTTAPTRWQLDPDYYYNSSGDLIWNRRAVIAVDVPALTDLMLTYTANGQTHPMSEAPSKYPGEPDHYGTNHTDDGETRHWFITVGTNSCVDPATFHIIDVSRKTGSPQSSPLDVTLKISGASGCQPTAPFGAYASSGSSTSSTTSGGGSSGCPSGEQLFKICSKCQASAGATPIYFYDEGCYKNWQTAQTIHGNGCTLSQVSGPSQCKLP